MSENIIYCYSGSGHCLNMAESIARVLGDTDIILMRSFPAKTDATEAKRVGFIFPCYGGGLPGDVEQYVRSIRIAPGAYKFAVEQFAGYMGCGLHKIDELVDLDYWDTISNHSTAIWLMPHTLTFPPTSKKTAQKRLDKKAAEVGAAVKAMERSEKKACTPDAPRSLLRTKTAADAAPVSASAHAGISVLSAASQASAPTASAASAACSTVRRRPSTSAR